MNFTRTAIGKTVAATVFASFLVVFGSPYLRTGGEWTGKHL